MTRTAAMVLLLLAVWLPACQVVRPPAAVDPWARFARSPDSVAPGGEPVLDPLALAPADTRFHIHVRDLAKLRTSAGDDPLATLLLQEMARIRHTRFWRMLRDDFAVGDDELLDRMFGRSLALVGTKASTTAPYVAMSLVPRDDLRRLPSALNLVPHPRLPGVGRFDLYYQLDDDLIIGISQRLLAIADARHLEHTAKVLLFASDAMDAAALQQAGADTTAIVGRSLAEEPALKSLLAKLPPAPQAMLYARNRSGDERHAVGVVRRNRQVEVHYAAKIPKFDELEDQFALGSGVEFGLLPADTISAASINLRKKDDRDLGFMDWFIFPRSLGRHILPHLGTPVLAFMGRVPADRVEPNVGFDFPAFGVAVRVTDPAVAADLDRVVMAVHFMLHLSELDLGKSFFGKATQVTGRTPFKMTDFGGALLRHIDDPQIRRLLQLPAAGGLSRVSFGRIGDWYVVTTHDAFFRQCAEAWQDHTQRLTSTAAFNALPLTPRKGLIVSIVSRAPQLSAMLDGADGYLKQAAQPARVEQADPADQDPEADQPQTPDDTSADARPDEPVEASPDDEAEPQTQLDAIAAELLGDDPAQGDAAENADADKAEADDGDEDDDADSMPQLRRPMRRIARSIERSHSFVVQVWRDDEGTVRGLLRFFAK